MSWLTNFVRPKIRVLVAGNDVPDNLWDKCTSCGHMLFRKALADNMYVCPHCDCHIKLPVIDRIHSILDDDSFVELKIKNVAIDPLKFKDTKKYVDRIKEYKAKTNSVDAIKVGYGKIFNDEVTIACFNFDFMGGSMGMYVGEGLIKAVEHSLAKKVPLIIVPCSGGARMQEGMFSLMQMPRTVAAINMLKSAKIPYLSVLTNPTTGGVSASFALLGDINIAEPGALIAFTGPRVIEGTIKEKLPEGFQKSEYLLDHGMVDLVVHRKEMKNTLSKIIKTLYYKK